MIALAVVCLVLAALAAVGAALVGFDDRLELDTFAGTIVTNPFWVFVTGAATMLVAAVGWSLLRRGARRQVARRREMKRLRRVEEQVAVSGRRGPGRGDEPGDRDGARHDGGGTAAGTDAADTDAADTGSAGRREAAPHDEPLGREAPRHEV
ncbi:hypothetical protein GCM10025868_18330 [Angustibacter aerolatus]|uniref:Lipopolysaccharide assembly protein A domain-containing protein n=1 Tax=Angustibacter aerolatus TaxID=1162965 RepID=A0ABQ6JGQ2_9ACTN|nr:hypothetical protein [Angustibacter aerolatus]GMA86583.1 hypothetical protein GCM10025868_18330 [Angustibacter aerolatus]